MKKIIHVVKEADHTDVGVCKLQVAVSLAKAQAAIGLRVSLWILGNEKDLDAGHQVDVSFFPLEPGWFSLPSEIIAAVSQLESGAILHLHGGFVPEFYALTRFVKKHHPLVVIAFSPQGDYNEPDLRRLTFSRRVYYYLFERITIKNANIIHLTGPSEVSGYRFFLEHATPFVCLPNGIDHSETTLSERKAQNTFGVTYVGVQHFFAPGIDILCEAFARLKDKVPGAVHLYLAGEGRDLEAIKAMTNRLMLGDLVTFIHPLTDANREELFARTTVYVQASRSDHFPVQALEAASRGIPLVVSEQTNLGNFIRQYESGWSLARNNSVQLAEVLLEAYHLYNGDNEAFRRLQRNAQRMIKEELNWQTLAKKWREVYLGLSGSRSESPAKSA